MNNIFEFGKYKGQTMEDVLSIDPSYVRWLAKNKVHESEYCMTEEQSEHFLKLCRRAKRQKSKDKDHSECTNKRRAVLKDPREGKPAPPPPFGQSFSFEELVSQVEVLTGRYESFSEQVKENVQTNVSWLMYEFFNQQSDAQLCYWDDIAYRHELLAAITPAFDEVFINETRHWDYARPAAKGIYQIALQCILWAYMWQQRQKYNYYFTGVAYLRADTGEWSRKLWRRINCFRYAEP